MFKVAKVKAVKTTARHVMTIIYEEDGIDKFAACVENLSVNIGDEVEIYTDDYVNYQGFAAMALRIPYTALPIW